MSASEAKSSQGIDPTVIRARSAGSLSDLISISGRAIRAIPRDPEQFIPAMLVPLFFFIVNVGSLQNIAESTGAVGNFKAFQLPVAILFASTGVSRASALVYDIQDGYFDRLLMTPVKRPTLLLGLLAADFAMIVALCIPVLFLGTILGVHFATGFLGLFAFLFMAGCWGVAFNGFTYAIALKTGSPAAVNSSFILFFPFAFLTTSFLPKEALTGWLATIAEWNPVTYMLAGLRAILSGGWEWGTIGTAFFAIALVGILSMTLSLLALKSRVKRG
ncbi:MAG: ABC transporter permease [Acidimicrobiia bacterium]|nr:ABC transporter permease [Acidimicrobiia bacterium]MBJ7381076.1 ABC transporter permease [Acidimicrobiia bacterium]MBJ7513200.1 ABC transporter permease [Acidimicrobiia bacterium]